MAVVRPWPPAANSSQHERVLPPHAGRSQVFVAVQLALGALIAGLGAVAVPVANGAACGQRGKGEWRRPGMGLGAGRQ